MKFDKSFTYSDCGLTFHGYCTITPGEPATHDDPAVRPEAEISELVLEGFGPYPLGMLDPTVVAAIERNALKGVQ